MSHAYIDIADEQQIAALLADPANYVIEAFRCEWLDGWVPDIGLTEYPYGQSIFRPPSVVSAQIPSLLRHRRFRQLVQGRSEKFRGMAYIGLVLYAAAGEQEQLAIQLRDQVLGMIAPTRHDNRRHLLVLDRPAEFIGQMEVLQIRATGGGTCRIEKIVFLRERPVASQFLPTISQLSAQIIERNGAAMSVHIHAITAEVARLHIQCDDEQQVAQTPPGRLHSAMLTGVIDQQARFILTARTAEGASDTAILTLPRDEPAAPTNKGCTIPVEVLALRTDQQAGQPLRFGVPIGQGQVWQPHTGQLSYGAWTATAQLQTLARWPDGSTQWALVDSLCPPFPLDSQAIQATLHIEPGSAPGRGLLGELSTNGLLLKGQQLQVSMAAHPSAIVIERSNNAHSSERASIQLPQVVLGNGYLLHNRIEELVFEEQGFLQTTARLVVAHCDSQSTAHVRSVLRVQCYADQPVLTLTHRLEVISPCLTPAAGGSAHLPRVPEELLGAIGFGEGEKRSLLKLRSVQLTIEHPANQQVWHEEQSWPLGGKDTWRLVHEHDLAYQRGLQPLQEAISGRVPGHVCIESGDGLMVVGLRHFWQRYPKAITVTGTHITLELLPETSAAPFPGGEEEQQRLAFWRADDGYLLKTGMAPRSELLLGLLKERTAAPWFAWFEQPPLARTPVDVLNASQAWTPIAPKQHSPLPRYETMIDQALDEWLADREQLRQYGWVNYGDWYGESQWSWGNNEYDSPFVHYSEFLRGGRASWFALGSAAAQHLADIDTCNFSTHPSQIGGQYIHMPGHAGGYFPPYFRSKIAGSAFDTAHTWGEGAVLHYLLTGDRASYESLLRTAQWRLGDWLDYYDFENARSCGWHLIHLCAVARLAGAERYRNAAYILVERVLARQEPGGGWERQLTASHCGCPPPRCRGEAGFMVGVLIAGLRQYYALSSDQRVAEAIIGGARWLVSRTYAPEAGHFRYTSCPNLGMPGPEHTLPIIEALGYAYALSGDPALGTIVKRSLDHLGLPRQNTLFTGYGKALGMEARYVPYMLYGLHNDKASTARRED
jgi:hypothetical protein